MNIDPDFRNGSFSMTTAGCCTAPSARRTLPALLEAGSGVSARILGALKRSLQTRAERRALRQLLAYPDYLLDDIGLTRADLVAELDLLDR